jgi:hypothetical protein
MAVQPVELEDRVVIGSVRLSADKGVRTGDLKELRLDRYEASMNREGVGLIVQAVLRGDNSHLLIRRATEDWRRFDLTTPDTPGGNTQTASTKRSPGAYMAMLESGLKPAPRAGESNGEAAVDGAEMGRRLPAPGDTADRPERKSRVKGSVIRRGDRWAFKIDLGPDPITGKRRQKMVSGFADKEEAERECRKALVDLDQGSYVHPGKQSVAEYLEEWLQAIAPTLRPATLHSCQRNLRLHVSAHIGSVRLTRLDPLGLNRLYAHLLKQGRRGNRPGGLSPRTVRYIHTIVHRALRDAVRWGRLARIVADAADPPRPNVDERPGVQAWSKETLAEFLEHSKGYGDRYYPLWVALATTGARRGEVLGLRWSDVDLDVGRAAIRQTVIAVNHDVRLGFRRRPRVAVRSRWTPER